MKIWENKSYRQLFVQVGWCIVVFALLSTGLVGYMGRNAIGLLLCSFFGMGVVIWKVCYAYFQKQDQVMACAAEQMVRYLSGDRDVCIACEEEGQLSRLLHEMNSLIDILDAHMENDKRAKVFLKEIISDISHQLKTPLAALNIYQGILQEEAKDLPTIKEFVDLSEQELDRIETLVQNLLKITKFDAGAIVLEKTEESIAEMMEQIKRSFSVRAGQEGKKIVLSGDPDVVFVCDRSWLLEAVSNLVKNALDHMQEGEEVQIAWKQFASEVQISVKDNGCGIHPEDLYHIFKRFYRSRYSQNTQGIGLGLPLTKLIIEAHNGTVKVDSALGVGTHFTMDFLIPTKL